MKLSEEEVNELAVAQFACPRCGARVGEWCKRGGVRSLDNTHDARRVNLPLPNTDEPASVQAIPTYFESNRRKH